MITLLGTLIGFLSSVVPDLVKLFHEHQDRRHELAILDMQLAQQREGFSQRLQEIQVQTDISQSNALYKTWRSDIRWVDALNGTVRPVLAYCFFLLYFTIKCMQFSLIDWETPLPWQVQALWGGRRSGDFCGHYCFLLWAARDE